ncbi:MAG: nuclear transport factor 2 family protein [Phycisphaerales bacterium]
MSRAIWMTLPVVAAGAVCHAAEPVTEQAVENALREYVTAKYTGDAETVRERTHHAISRYALAHDYWGNPCDDWLRQYNWDVLRFYSTDRNNTRTDSPEDARLDIEVFDVERWSASAMFVSEDAVDLVHLVLFDGSWVVVDSAVTVLSENGAEPPTQDSSERDAVRQVVEDYCRGFYEVDGDKVQGTCHPGLSKRETRTSSPEDGSFSFMRSISYEEIKILGDIYNRSGHIDAGTAPVEIDVYYVDGETAAAKLVADGWFDYFHLFKVNGDWKIANIIFEPLAG